MQPIGADDELRRHGLAGLEPQFDPIGRLREPDAAAAQVNRPGLCGEQCLGEHIVQIAAVNGDVGKAVALNQFQADL